MSVKSIGEFVLYDPNENIGGNQYSSYGFGTNPDSNNAVNQEDLIMYCNLRAFTRPRSYIMNSTTSGAKLQSVASARINFLKPNPEKNKFTTDWTELDASGRPNSDEMLGINSVQITYDTSYVPRVTITMTDVRGQALNEDPANSPYGAFFNFPYPMFVLEVKGYYGKAVKYLLHLLKYSSRFDYATGNFQITCEFVGFTYALLSDLNVQYGLVASQMELNGKSGKERLIKKYEAQIQKYKDVPGFSEDIKSIIDEDNGGVYSLVGLINKSRDLNTFVESQNQNNKLFIEKGSLDSFIDVIQIFYDQVTKERVVNSGFNEYVKKINGNSLFNDFPNYSDSLKCNINAPTDKPLDEISQDTKNQYIRYFENSKNLISRRNNEILKIIDEDVSSQLTAFLGFKPSVRNIMLIICNNFELFLDLLTETTQRAADNDNRKKTLRDIVEEGDPKRNDNKGFELVYPWPALYDTNYEICYFDDLPELNIGDYPEKDFVESYLNATKYTNDLLARTGDTNTISTETANQVLYNPIHTQQYDVNNLEKPIFNKDINKCLVQIVEHALLISSNSWSNLKIDQISKFGEVDAENLYNNLGNTGIKPYLTILNNNLDWINDSKDNTTNNQPLGVLQLLTNPLTKLKIDKDNNPFNKLKEQFHYIKDYKSDYLTDIVETESINKLKGKYNSLEDLRFTPEVNGNLLNPGGGDYGAGNVKYGNNGFITYEKEKSNFSFPNKISLLGILQPFMNDYGNNYSAFNKTLLGVGNNINYDNLLFSLKAFLLDIQTTIGNIPDFWRSRKNFQLDKTENKDIINIFNNTPGIGDEFGMRRRYEYVTIPPYDFVLFNGVHKTKMACALNYLFFNDNQFLDPFDGGDYRDLNKYNYYFPFTTTNSPNSYEYDRNVYINNTTIFLRVYKQLIENIISIMSSAPTVTNNEIGAIDLYFNSYNGVPKVFTIDKDGNPSLSEFEQDKNKKQYSEIYGLLKEFFETEIQMVSKSNGLSNIYKDPFKYWTNNGDWDNKKPTNDVNRFIKYDNIRYDGLNSGTLIKNYFIGFRRKIREIQKKVTESDKNNPETGSKTTSVKTANDLKKSFYQTFKNINDKWVIDEINGGIPKYTWGLTGDVDSNENVTYDYNRQYLFDHFFFVDRVNKDIGNDLLLDFRVLDSYYEQVNSKNSLYSIIGELAKMNEMIFHPLTSYINFGGLTSSNNKKASIDNLFKPLTTLDFQSSSPVFIMQYVGKNASYQYENQNHLPDVIKIDFSGDNLKFSSPKNTSPFNGLTDENKVNTPVAFFVDMGIKNQNMFRGISLDQAEFRETNESITVWDQLTSQKQSRSIQTIGNNVYPILSRRSYTCKVESLGNMMIQPTMYFYLRYIPLFSGLYLITKVSHSIQPNNVVTNFEGVRMSTLNFPLVTQFISTLTKEILEKNANNINFSTKENPNYWDNLKPGVIKSNIITFYNAIKDVIPNPAVQAAMIAVAFKESGMIPKSESTKEVTNTKRFVYFDVFDNLKKYTTEGPNGIETSPFINELKKYPVAFYNFVYGTGDKAKEFKNKPATKNPINITDSNGKVIIVYDDPNGDGYKYRGRGYNGITGRENYEKAKNDTNVDVIKYPDELNKPDTAAKAMLGYMKRGATGRVKESSAKDNRFYQVYSRTPLENYDSTDYQKAYNTIFSLNAGPGNSMEFYLSIADVKRGYNDGYFILQSIYNAIKEGKIK